MFNFLAISAFDFKAIFKTIITRPEYYIIAFCVLLIVLLVAFLIKPKYKITTSKTKKIAILGILTAFSVVANIYSFGPQNAKISLVATIGFISGVALGPINGFTIGFLGDLVGAIIAPQGAYNPALALSSALMGYIPGVIFWYIKGNGILKTLISFAVVFFVCSVFINSYGVYLMYYIGKPGKSFYTCVIARIPVSALGIFLNMLVSMLLLAPIKKVTKRIVTESK